MLKNLSPLGFGYNSIHSLRNTNLTLYAFQSNVLVPWQILVTLSSMSYELQYNYIQHWGGEYACSFENKTDSFFYFILFLLFRLSPLAVKIFSKGIL